MYAKHKRDTNIQTGIAVGYVFARTEESINSIRNTTRGEINESELAGWLVQLIRAKYTQSGSVLLGSEHMPTLRRKTAAAYKKLAAKKTLHVPSRKHKTRKVGRPRLVKGIKAYWASMTPEERSREMRRRRNLGKERKAA